MTETVEYREIPRLPGYRIGDDGSFWSHKRGEWLRVEPWANSKGYLRVGPSVNGKRLRFSVHRLVLEAFVGPCPDGMEGCHNDGDKSNNRPSNLRWDTQSANSFDNIYRHGEKCKHGAIQLKLADADVVEIRKLLASGVDTREISRRFGIGSGHVRHIRNRRERRQAEIRASEKVLAATA